MSSGLFEFEDVSVSVLCGMALCHNSKLGSKGVSIGTLPVLRFFVVGGSWHTFKRYISVHHEDGVTESRPSPVELFEFEFDW
jgi:hypothetical protein